MSNKQMFEDEARLRGCRGLSMGQHALHMAKTQYQSLASPAWLKEYMPHNSSSVKE
jgi:hypothetical protein